MADKVISAKEYKKATRKLVTAPSGAKFLIKKVTNWDFIHSPYLPVGFDIRRFQLEAQAISEEAQNPQDLLQKHPREAAELARMYVIVGVVSPRIVDKPLEECGEDELSIYELLEEDLTFLLNEILEFSGLGKGATERVAPFLPEPEPTIVRPPSEKVSQASPRTNESDTI